MPNSSEPHIFSYGSPDAASISEACKNFTSGRYSPFSFCTTPVEILANDGSGKVMSHGTGFYWHKDGRDWLITCWHVVSGRNPFTGELMSSNGLIPKTVNIKGWKLQSLPGVDIEVKRTGYTYTFPDHAIEALEKPPEIDGKIVDIFALPLMPDFAINKDFSEDVGGNWANIDSRINNIPTDKIATIAGDECVILGYPLSNYTGLTLPIWKTGSLSTESKMSLDGSPAFLIDAATSSAMSGSPVLRRSAAIATYDKDTQIVSEHRGYQLVGVYAGRLQNKQLEQIGVGYAWFASLIPQVIEYCAPFWEGVIKKELEIKLHEKKEQESSVE